MIDDPRQVSVAAQAGLAALNGPMTEAAKLTYLGALETVRQGLLAVVSDPDVASFLDQVLISEIQTAPHICCGDEPGAVRPC